MCEEQEYAVNEAIRYNVIFYCWHRTWAHIIIYFTCLKGIFAEVKFSANVTFLDGEQKVDEKAMIRKRYNQIPHPASDAKQERNTNN